ncbi:magnesium transport protein cora [Podospora australis]|uniref:Magnesium transport protein cora n=1 Tax=Podospora australis TaxID=1536484 RepID=A0AAN6WJP2_9PEZI|nr:magnesium transport protein cora [Podospora australis]
MANESRPDISGAGNPESRDFAAIAAADPLPANTTTPTTTASSSDTAGHQDREATTIGNDPQGSHVRYALNVETGQNPATTTPTRAAIVRTNTEAPFSPVIRRRTRVGTFRTVDDFEDFEVRPGWHPGSEPGVDPSKPDGGHGSMPALNAPCEINIVDFNEDKFSIQKHNNESLSAFMNLPQPKWAKCRWISVNGLSWDVIQLLGRHKNLHKLAIEDIMNTRNRTKAEWYSTHAFLVLTLQKLVHLYDSSDEERSDSDSSDDAASRTSRRSVLSKRSAKASRRVMRKLKRTFGGGSRNTADPSIEDGKSTSQEDSFYLEPQPTGFSDAPDISQLRTLQRYHSSPNDPRTQFMERNSALASRNIAVSCEQVSIFITSDNTIISFFELSASDVEEPIIRRLQTNDTVVRESCDASMVCQAIIDAIIDLAIPVTTCYTDVINDIELDVLTRPNISHTKKLYICISEINKMLSFITPITTLIQALRDHKTDMSLDKAMAKVWDPTHDPLITSLTYTYLGDVLDHSVLIGETLNQLKSSADGMIDLIFNTISAHQNESMQQLTAATIIFLPLTFITGYFGQNFEPFSVLKEDIGYFWKIAVPVVIATILILQRELIFEYFKALLQRRYILRLKKNRPRRDKKRA